MKTTLSSLETLVAAQSLSIKDLTTRLEKLERRSKAAAIAYLKSKDTSSNVSSNIRDQRIAESMARREQLRLRLDS